MAKQQKKKSNGFVTPLVTFLVIVLIAGLILLDQLSSNGTLLRHKKALESDNYVVTGTMMQYATMSTYQNFVSQNQSYLQYFGLDTSKKLSKQSYGEGTWLDFFKQSAETSLSTYLVYAEAAKAAGVTLDDDEMKSIDENIDAIKTIASLYGYANADSYLAAAYGVGVKTKDVRAFLELATLANKYETEVYNEIKDNVTDDEIAAEYKENPDTYSYATIISYSDSITLDTALTDDEKAAEKEAFLAKFNAIAESEDVKEAIRSYLENKNLENADNPDVAGVDIETELSKVEETLSKAGISPTDASDWVFENTDGVYARANGEVKVFETYTEGGETSDGAAKPDTYKLTVVYVVKAPYANDKGTKDVGHILFLSSSYASDDEAKAEAEKVLKLYQDGEMTKEAFEALGDEYTEDSSVFYNNVKDGEMVDEFNDWLFDEAREAGDVEIVKTEDYGYHIMYYVGDGERCEWQVDCASAIVNEKSSAKTEELTEQYKITINEKAIKSVKG